MNASLKKPIPWRECAFLSTAEAAAIFGRSPTWVHNRITDGSLVCARIPAGGSAGITVASVIALIDAAEPITDEPMRALRPHRSRPELVVSNDR